MVLAYPMVLGDKNSGNPCRFNPCSINVVRVVPTNNNNLLQWVFVTISVVITFTNDVAEIVSVCTRKSTCRIISYLRAGNRTIIMPGANPRGPERRF